MGHAFRDAGHDLLHHDPLHHDPLHKERRWFNEALAHAKVEGYP